jgi:transposase-like protein
MKKFALPQDKNPSEISARSALEEVLREGAKKLLQEAIENEVIEYVQKFQEIKDEMNKRLVTRNGHLPARDILTGLGPINIQQPRIRDKRDGEDFSSAIIPKYKRKTENLERLIPELYLRGISTNNFPKALSALLGENAAGLSSANITRMKNVWEQEYTAWQKRDLTGKRYVYFWADGIYFNIRLEEGRPCLLILIGATEDGRKEIVGIYDGIRESKLSWQEFLQNLKSRGLVITPSLAIGDGALGFWNALEEEFPQCRQQRCWVHKTANILDKMSKSVQPNAKGMIHEMYLSPTKEAALKSYEGFLKLYTAKYPGACKCLEKDKDQLFTFYDFPAEHWAHIRTTNPIESMFATVRHRTRQTKGCGNRMATLTMVYKMAKVAEEGWRRLRGFVLLSKIVAGTKFKDGEEVITKEQVA